MNIIDFNDLARGGTAPEYAKKHANSNQVLGAAIKARPKTRSADSDMADFNMDLRAQKSRNAQSYEYGGDSAQAEFRRTQGEDEYFKAIESFQAAVEDWSGRSDFDAPNRPPSGGAGTQATSLRGSTAASRSRSGGKARSGSSAYTQNVPQILLQTSKRPTAKSTNPSPRVGRNDVRADIRAAYGADDLRAGSALGARPKAPPRPSSQRTDTGGSGMGEDRSYMGRAGAEYNGAGVGAGGGWEAGRSRTHEAQAGSSSAGRHWTSTGNAEPRAGPGTGAGAGAGAGPGPGSGAQADSPKTSSSSPSSTSAGVGRLAKRNSTGCIEPTLDRLHAAGAGAGAG
ncbi:hypothetical protein B484DRAFT_27547, partial [Ochromonadaceae sp. CCMP2298]